MLIKHFKRRSALQKDRNTNLITDICELLLQVGLIIIDPTFESSVGNVSTEKVMFHNWRFYKKNKMTFKEMKIANNLTVVILEALLLNQIFDQSGLGSTNQYSPTYGESFEWVDIPNVKIKYHWLSKNRFDLDSKVIMNVSSSQLYMLKQKKYLVDELNQAVKKVADVTMQVIELDNKGNLVFSVQDNTYDSRFIWNHYDEMTNDLLTNDEENNVAEIPLTKDIIWNTAESSNLLLAGEIGGGKTNMCLSLMAAESYKNWKVWVIDGKDSDLAFMGKKFLPTRTATTGESALDLLHQYSDEMNQRYKNMQSIREKKPEGHILTDYRAFNMRPSMLFIDEWAAILTQMDSKSAKEADSFLKELILKNRQSGNLVCISLQHPNAKNINSEVRDNLLCRIFTGKPQDEVKRMMFGSGIELPDIPFSEPGEGFIQIAGNIQIPVLFKSPTLPKDKNDLYDFMAKALSNQKDFK